MQERRAHAGPPDQDLDGLVRHVALADWLVLAVVLLHQLVAARGGLSLPVAGAIGVFAAFSVLLRTPWLPLTEARARLELETWAMAAFISFIVWRTGGVDSPLQSLYLLPIVLASLVLPVLRHPYRRSPEEPTPWEADLGGLGRLVRFAPGLLGNRPRSSESPGVSWRGRTG